MAQKQAAKDQMGRRQSKWRREDVMDREGNAIGGGRPCDLDEAGRSVEANYAIAFERIGDEMGGEPGTAPEVERERDSPRAGGLAEEALCRFAKDLRQQLQPPRGKVAIAEEVVRFHFSRRFLSPPSIGEC
jgi:hypothetical protein